MLELQEEDRGMDESVPCAGYMMSKPEFIRAWMAFRDLHKRGIVEVVFKPDRLELQHARNEGWQLEDSTWRQKYCARMSDHPWDFNLGFRWGVDLVIAGPEYQTVHPRLLYSIAISQVGTTEIDRYFLPSDVQNWVNQFNDAELTSKAWKYQESR
jgi:hypothetical protein